MSVSFNVRIFVFPPQSFLPGHTKGLPIGIILSFCSPNFYEVDFPCIFFFLKIVSFHALRCYDLGGAVYPAYAHLALSLSIQVQADPRPTVLFHSTHKITFAVEDFCLTEG